MHDYVLKFTQLFVYAPKMVKDMRIRMSLFITVLGRSSRTEGRIAIYIGHMDKSMLMVYVNQLDEEKFFNIEK